MTLALAGMLYLKATQVAVCGVCLINYHIFTFDEKYILTKVVLSVDFSLRCNHKFKWQCRVI